jgi:hypothetical protein
LLALCKKLPVRSHYKQIAMKPLVLISLFVAGVAWAQSGLPQCDSRLFHFFWNNCFGTATSSGETYSGEWKDGKRHGQGRANFLWSQGKANFLWSDRPVQEGIWENDRFVSARRVPDHIVGGASIPISAQAPRHAQPAPGQTFNSASTSEDWFPIIGSGGTREVDRSSIKGLDSMTYIYKFRIDTDLSVTWWGRVNCRAGTRGEDRTAVPESLYSVFSSVTKAEFEAVCSVAEAEYGSNRLANTNSKQSGAKASRQAEPPRSTLSISAAASRPDANGVVTLTITTNSDTASLKVNGDEAGGRADGRYTLKRFARVGDNSFEVVAIDRFGNTQKQAVSVVREPADTNVMFAALNPMGLRGRPTADAVAIIIGIQDYRRVPKADFASNDARVFYDYAIRGLGVRPENVKLLTDDQADDVAILGAFKNWLPLKSRKAKTDVYVFYSGHGYPSDDGSSLYFLPHGVDRQFLDRTAIKQFEIVNALQAVSPRSVTLFLDACYSGQSRTGETLLAGARPILIQPKASTFPSNFTVLSASAPEQIASSSPDLKHGIFSYFLMKGMEGEADQNKDGAITVQEMQAYLLDSVGRKAMSINRTQQPQLVGDQSRVLMQR